MDVIEVTSTRDGCCGMLVKLSKVLTKLALSVNVKVGLIAEEDHATSGYQAGQIIFLSVGELRKIDAMDFRANLGRVIENVGCFGQKITELRMTIETFVMVGYFGQW